MGALARFRPGFRRTATLDESPSVTMDEMSSGKNPAVYGTDAISPTSANGEPAVEEPDKNIIAEDAQRGVAQVEAVTITWTKPHLIAVFML